MNRRPPQRDGESRGSALVMAIFVLVLVTSMGVALLTLSQFEQRMVQADKRGKVAFFLAEAGLEHGREALYLADAASASVGALDDELAHHAGPNGLIDFDPDTVRPTYDADGQVTGFTGHGDDVPLLDTTALADGRYVAFLTNDPLDDAVDPLDDTNGAVTITAVSGGRGFTSAVVQAIVRRSSFPALPATITLLGPDPLFEGGKSNAKLMSGDDCALGLYYPVVGVIGSSAETLAESGVEQPATFVSGPLVGVDTVTDVDATIHPSWKDCGYLLELAGQIKGSADVVGDSTTPDTSLGTPADPRTVFIEGNYTISGNHSGVGMLWVTGELTINGSPDWDGLIFVVGTGAYQGNGGGNGTFSGGWLVANIAGPDGVLFTADDCAGDDGTSGTADDGFQSAGWATSGGGKSKTGYCSTSINGSQQLTFVIDHFRQR